MGLLDFDDTYKPPFTPHIEKRSPAEEEERLAELNNYGRDEVRPDFDVT